MIKSLTYLDTIYAQDKKDAEQKAYKILDELDKRLFDVKIEENLTLVDFFKAKE